MNTYFDGIFSKFQCGLHKGYTIQYRKIGDSMGAFATVLTDLSKVFNYISHDLLIAKLYAYGFDKVLSNFIYPCLRQRKQKTKVGSTFSDLLKILFGVPQGSILDRFNL